ncbi:WbqC family protein [Actinomyces bowdenii]|uniref:WbqC family protein n=1 Tax=Actinomyces bowdenii TaxID=131109 RepID=UPI001ABD34EB|nr:WbqC family protein [Actinomyces bowdenii]
MNITCVTSRYIPNVPHLVRLLEVDRSIVLDLSLMPDRNKNSFVNRNRILTANGDTWLTIPVHRQRGLPVCDIKICEEQSDWRQRHLSILRQAYPKLDSDGERFLEIYRSTSIESGSLVHVNMIILEHLFDCLSIKFPNISLESSLTCTHPHFHRWHLSEILNASTYVAGSVEFEVMRRKGREISRFHQSKISIFEGRKVKQKELIHYSAIHWLLNRGSAWTREQIEALYKGDEF